MVLIMQQIICGIQMKTIKSRLVSFSTDFFGVYKSLKARK